MTAQQITNSQNARRFGVTSSDYCSHVIRRLVWRFSMPTLNYFDPGVVTPCDRIRRGKRYALGRAVVLEEVKLNSAGPSATAAAVAVSAQATFAPPTQAAAQQADRGRPSRRRRSPSAAPSERDTGIDVEPMTVAPANDPVGRRISTRIQQQRAANPPGAQLARQPHASSSPECALQLRRSARRHTATCPSLRRSSRLGLASRKARNGASDGSGDGDGSDGLTEPPSDDAAELPESSVEIDEEFAALLVYDRPPVHRPPKAACEQTQEQDEQTKRQKEQPQAHAQNCNEFELQVRRRNCMHKA